MDHGAQALKELENDIGQPTMNLDAALEAIPVLMCPHCYVPMDSRPYAASGNRLDRCPQCVGLWLDARELSAAAESYARNQDFFR